MTLMRAMRPQASPTVEVLFCSIPPPPESAALPTRRWQVVGSLKVSLQKLGGGEGKVDIASLSDSQRSRLRVKFCGDLEVHATPVVMTLEAAVAAIEKIPDALARGESVPVGKLQ